MSKFVREQPQPTAVDLSLSANSDSLLAYGAAAGDLSEIRPLRTTANGSMVVEGSVSIDGMVHTQTDAELVGPTVEKMLDAQLGTKKELGEIHDDILAIGVVLEKTIIEQLAKIIDLLQAIAAK